MIKVKSRGNETAEQMLRRFKKMCEKEGLTKDIKRVAYYEKPSEKKTREKGEAIRRRRKLARKLTGLPDAEPWQLKTSLFKHLRRNAE